jgi:FKBP-type peptidyl-prolyl cis-trans isomerase 2
VFKIGEGEVPAGFESTIIGMKAGEEKITLLEPKEAFGEKRDGVTFEVNKESFPEDVRLYIGQEIWAQKLEGEDLKLFVTDMNDDVVILDENHPLAGKDIVLDIELVEIL